MQHLEGSGTPVLYIGRTVLKGYTQIAVTMYLVYRSTIKYSSLELCINTLLNIFS